MQNSKLIQKYQCNVNKIREQARECNLTDDEINEIFKKCFTLLQNDLPLKKQARLKTVFNVTLCLAILSLIIYVLLNVHQPTSSIVLRNVQSLIYPGFKIIRSIAVPVIRTFPALTELYDETCLVENPYFYVTDMECWPCENVHSVIDLTGFSNHSLYQSGVPYIVQTNQKPVTFTTLKNLYESNKQVFDNDASRIKSTNTSLSTISELFSLMPNQTASLHILWRINRMAPARLMRSLFPKPLMVSDWSGQSIERFIMIDEPFAKVYILPNPECSYVFLIQGSGQRTIILRPSRECGSTCKTVSVLLKPGYVLWYNWWYWRPLSLPVSNATDISISYLSCYC